MWNIFVDWFLRKSLFDSNWFRAVLKTSVDCFFDKLSLQTSNIYTERDIAVNNVSILGRIIVNICSLKTIARIVHFCVFSNFEKSVRLQSESTGAYNYNNWMHIVANRGVKSTQAKRRENPNKNWIPNSVSFTFLTGRYYKSKTDKDC